MQRLNGLRRIHVGTSGWAISRQIAPGSRPDMSALERYAEHFDSVEVNSTFYHLPRSATIERWRDATPPGFSFAVKTPRAITHEARLVAVDDRVSEFCELIAHFESKLGPLLVQLPPSFALDIPVVSRFLAHLTRRCPTPVVLEPRHPTWFVADAKGMLAEHGVARVAADPACCAAAALPIQHRGIDYFRWHGSPRRYFSAYPPEALRSLARRVITSWHKLGARHATYCFMDNTALGAAPLNALSLRAELVAIADGLQHPAERRSDLGGNGSTERARPGRADRPRQM